MPAIDRSTAELEALRPQVQARANWERAHKPDLERLAVLGRQIDHAYRLDRIAERVAARAVERGQELDLDLGL